MVTGLSGGALSQCEACRTIYREAERMIGNGTFQTIAGLSTGILCSALDAVAGTPGIFGMSCLELAKKVL